MNIRYTLLLLTLAAAPAIAMQETAKKGVKRKAHELALPESDSDCEVIDLEETLKFATQENDELREKNKQLKKKAERLAQKAKRYKKESRENQQAAEQAQEELQTEQNRNHTAMGKALQEKIEQERKEQALRAQLAKLHNDNAILKQQMAKHDRDAVRILAKTATAFANEVTAKDRENAQLKEQLALANAKNDQSEQPHSSMFA